MHVDGFTFLAQIVNFLVLVALLRHFLYGPVTRAMAEREAKIADQLDEAAQRQADAQQSAEDYRQKLQQLEQERAERIAQLKGEIDALRTEWTHEAKREVEKAKRRWHEALTRERTTLLQQFKQELAGDVLTVSRRILADLADADLERLIVDRFLDHLTRLDEQKRQQIRAALATDGADVHVRTAFACDEEMCRRIELSVQQQLLPGVRVHFESTGAVVSGIEMKAGGHKIAWSIDDYLDNLQQTVLRTLEQEPAR